MSHKEQPNFVINMHMRISDILNEGSVVKDPRGFLGGELWYQQHYRERQGQREIPQDEVNRLLSQAASNKSDTLENLPDGSRFVIKNDKLGLGMSKTERPSMNGRPAVWLWKIITAHNTLIPRADQQIIDVT